MGSGFRPKALSVPVSANIYQRHLWISIGVSIGVSIGSALCDGRCQVVIAHCDGSSQEEGDGLTSP